ncbi:hypothetical protein CspHIS471_0313990 [Cutaneotrichosporon sp. HIS471]|nr:hypothetical protein CspHIS471_0313990 [Cutaneotrichosporon sp. HIS471]
MLVFAALLTASALVSVSAAPTLGHGTLAPRGKMHDSTAAAVTRRDGWDDGWYHTFVKGALDCYSSPTYDSDKISYYKPGSSVVIGCQTHGEEVNGNDVWDFTIRDCYLPNDRLKVDSVWIPGMEDCDAATK